MEGPEVGPMLLKGKATDQMADAAALYNRQDIWGNAPNAYQVHVLRDLLSILPGDIASVLDVGCGDGFITNSLPDRLHVIGLDVGEASLKHVKRETKVGVVTALPFDADAFDLVMTNDTLEHIGELEFPGALAELKRVARKYLIVTVPFMENLKASTTICMKCGTTFHVHHHQRGFGVAELTDLFGPDWSPRVVMFSGTPMGPTERVARELRARSGLSGGWDKSVCPSCGQNGSRALMDERVVEDAIDLANRLVYPAMSWHVDRSECIVLYENIDPANGRANEEGPPTWSLSVTHGTSAKVFPATLGQLGQRLVLSADLLTCQDGDRVVMECQWNGVAYRLPEPEKVEARTFSVPLWFTPPSLTSISASHNTHDLAADTLVFMMARVQLWQKHHADRTGGMHARESEQLLQLWEMQVQLRSQIEAQEEEIRLLKEQLREHADVRDHGHH